jgi:hypothetical protein
MASELVVIESHRKKLFHSFRVQREERAKTVKSESLSLSLSLFPQHKCELFSLPFGINKILKRSH